MDGRMMGQVTPVKMVLRGVLFLLIAGLCIYAFERWGDQAMSRLSTDVAAEGRTGVLFFIAVNVFAAMLFVPQSVFTVAAGALFGWKFGTAWASVGMTIGAIGAFCIARYGVRDWLGKRFHENVVFMKMQSLGQTHPWQVIALSRIIPVVPFPLASYLLGVTEVRPLSYAFLTWLCMLPETLFLASGGHLLHSGITKGSGSVAVAIILGIAAVVFGVVLHHVKKSFLENAKG